MNQLTNRQKSNKTNNLNDVHNKLLMIKENLNNVLCVTRFNNETYREYQNYVNNEDYLDEKCFTKNVSERNYNIYNTPLPIAESKEFTNKYFLVIEMLNSDNTIRGISIIKNRAYFKRFKVYSDQNYNRYSYKIITRINRTDLLYFENDLVKKIEKLVFTDKNHLKRGQGIQMIKTNYYAKLKKSYNELELLESSEIENSIIETIWSSIVNNKNMIYDDKMTI